MPTSGVSAIPVALSPVEQDEIDRARARSLSQDHVGGIPRDTGRFLVVTGAQFIPRKGCHVLAEAAPLVRRVAPDVDFLWLGPMPLAAADAEMARAAGIRYVAQAELEHRREDYLALVARADLFVLPSFEEGLPLALIEAMALGVAAVATPVNAVTEAITHGETGLLVAPGDAAALAAAILQLRSDPDLRRQIAQAGQVHARRFDANKTARVTMRVYEEAAGRMAGLQP